MSLGHEESLGQGVKRPAKEQGEILYAALLSPLHWTLMDRAHSSPCTRDKYHPRGIKRGHEQRSEVKPDQAQGSSVLCKELCHTKVGPGGKVGFLARAFEKQWNRGKGLSEWRGHQGTQRGKAGQHCPREGLEGTSSEELQLKHWFFFCSDLVAKVF